MLENAGATDELTKSATFFKSLEVVSDETGPDAPNFAGYPTLVSMIDALLHSDF